MSAAFGETGRRLTPLMTVALPALALLGWPEFSADLAWRPGAIGEGEPWRVVTGHWVHLSYRHALVDLVAWLAIWRYGCDFLDGSAWTLGIVASCLGTSAGLAWYAPAIESYVGLSGLLHGVLAFVAIRRAARGDRWAAWVGAATVGKVAVEVVLRPDVAPAPWIGGLALPIAHAYGVASGLLASLALADVREGLLRRLLAAGRPRAR